MTGSQQALIALVLAVSAGSALAGLVRHRLAARHLADLDDRWQKRAAGSVVRTEPAPPPGACPPAPARPAPWTAADDDVVLGRSESADVHVEHLGTSRLHARLLWTEDGWLVHDLSSLNGTLVNGVPITVGWDNARLLAPDDVVTLGRGGPSFVVGTQPRAHHVSRDRA